MRTASLSAGWTKLHHGMQTLTVRWEEVQTVWNDRVRQDFEEQYWAPLEPHVQAALRSMDRLSQVLAQFQHECG